jgi:predicted metal-dependent peptidase
MRINEIIQEQAEPQPDRSFLSRCQAIVEKIAQTTPIDEYRAIIRTTSIEIEAPGSDKAYSNPSGRLVVIDEEEFATAPVTVLIWLMAHELGHVVMNHANQGSAHVNRQLEQQADEFANDITRRLGISRVPVFSWLGRRKNELGRTELERKQALERDPANADFFNKQDHPTIDMRIKQAADQGVELSKINTDQIDWLMQHTA